MKKILLGLLLLGGVFLIQKTETESVEAYGSFNDKVGTYTYRKAGRTDYRFDTYKETNNNTYYYYREDSMLSSWIKKPHTGELNFSYTSTKSVTARYSVTIESSIGVEYPGVMNSAKIASEITEEFTSQEAVSYSFSVKSTDIGVEHAVVGAFKKNAYKVKIYDVECSGPPWNRKCRNDYKSSEYFEAPFDGVIMRVFKLSDKNGAQVYYIED